MNGYLDELIDLLENNQKENLIIETDHYKFEITTTNLNNFDKKKIVFNYIHFIIRKIIIIRSYHINNNNRSFLLSSSFK